MLRAAARVLHGMGRWGAAFFLLLPGPAFAQTDRAPVGVEDDGGLVLRTIPAPTDTPGDIAWDGAALWIADWQRGELIRFDPERQAVLKRVPAPCYRPRGLTWADGRLYVADDFEGMIYVFDPETGRTLTRYATPQKGGLGLAWDGTALWLSENGDDTLQRLIPTDGTALTYFAAPQHEPGGMAFDGTYLWVAQRGQDRIYMVDPATGRALTSFDSPGPYPCGLAPAPEGRLWLADFETGLLYLCAPREMRGYQTRDWREAELHLTYRIENHGPGAIVDAAVHFAIADRELENQIEIDPPAYFPEPPRIHADQWEQSVATFTRARIAPGERFEVGYRTRVRVGSLAYILIPERAGTLRDIPREMRERYTVDADRFQVNVPLVRDTAKRIVGDEQNAYWIARKIFDWVIETLEYERVGGWDVPETLIKRKTGSCSEYAFLFIGLCRAAGLPARYEAGAAVRGDDASVDDVYHRWVEVYLPGYGWVPIDPSGGDQATPGGQADYIGRLSNRYFVTTHNGGDSNALSWNYNSFATYSLDGRCAITEDAWVAWRRAKEEGAAVVPSGARLAP
ncbi:MAG: transglutaminase domain-containing protein [Candidatus Eisenbacteria bacterium]